jgi:hypothetical protein
MRNIGVLGLAGFAFCSAAACDDAKDEIENTITCADVCERYQECVDADYDVAACTDRCEDDASSSETRESRLEECDACIEDRSCVGSAFACATECAGFID